jgi:hypothetical protein
MIWRLPDTYHLAGHGQGTATLKFYEGRDILPARDSRSTTNSSRRLYTSRRFRLHSRPGGKSGAERAVQNGHVSGQIPASGRERLLISARRRLPESAPVVISVIPVTLDSWRQSLTDAGLSGSDRLGFKELDNLLDPVNLTDSGRLRGSSVRLADRVSAIAEDLACLAALSPSGSAEASDLRNSLLQAASVTLGYLGGVKSQAGVARCWAAVDDAFSRLLAVPDTYTFPVDACEAAFGVAYGRLLDANGVFSPPRLLSAYYGRYGELARRVNSVLSAITTVPPDLLNAIAPAEALVLTSHSLVALRTARRVRDLIEHEFGADPERVATILHKLKLGVDRSAASHAAMVRLAGQIDRAETDAERAQMKLDWYRRMVEGQLRPWAWALLQICGRTGPKMPEVSSLREQLVSEGSPLLLDAAMAILPEARNASAHEDYLWDEDLSKLRVGNAVVNVEDLEEAANRAYTFMAAAESAWRCSRTALPGLARLLDAENPPGGLRPISERKALEHFGTNGLSLRRWTHENRRLTVILDELPRKSVDPCFQAVIWASRHLENAERVVVKIGDGTVTAMDLPRFAIDANFLVWNEAVTRFSVMPGTTFLVTNAAARLLVESPTDAARAVTWLALNDVVHAYIDGAEAAGPIRDRITRLTARLELAVISLSTTAPTLPTANLIPPIPGTRSAGASSVVGRFGSARSLTGTVRPGPAADRAALPRSPGGRPASDDRSRPDRLSRYSAVWAAPAPPRQQFIKRQHPEPNTPQARAQRHSGLRPPHLRHPGHQRPSAWPSVWARLVCALRYGTP